MPRQGAGVACGRDDVVRAIKALKVLGEGFAVVKLGQRNMVQSVPMDFSDDTEAALAAAQVRAEAFGHGHAVRFTHHPFCGRLVDILCAGDWICNRLGARATDRLGRTPCPPRPGATIAQSKCKSQASAADMALLPLVSLYIDPGTLN